MNDLFSFDETKDFYEFLKKPHAVSKESAVIVAKKSGNLSNNFYEPFKLDSFTFILKVSVFYLSFCVFLRCSSLVKKLDRSFMSFV